MHDNLISKVEVVGGENISHFGIKGMKWGRRRTPEQLGRARNKSERSVSKEASKMSDEELKKRVTRLNLEKQYTDLVKAKGKRELTASDKGRAAVKKAVGDAANENMKRLFKGASWDAGEQVFKLASVAAVNSVGNITIDNLHK